MNKKQERVSTGLMCEGLSSDLSVWELLVLCLLEIDSDFGGGELLCGLNCIV